MIAGDYEIADALIGYEDAVIRLEVVDEEGTAVIAEAHPKPIVTDRVIDWAWRTTGGRP